MCMCVCARVCVLKPKHAHKHTRTHPQPPVFWGQRSFPSGLGANEEVIVSFKTSGDHMDRVSSLDMETLSTGSNETKTLGFFFFSFYPQRPLLLQRCCKSRPGGGAPGRSETGEQGGFFWCFDIWASLNTFVSLTFHHFW